MREIGKYFFLKYIKNLSGHLEHELLYFFRQAGAIGSRLTGAGWGGCTVSLVPVNVIDDFMKKVHDGYYAADPEKLQRVSESLFATQPGSGAAILKLN